MKPNTDYAKASLEMHQKFHGKLEVVSKVPVKTRDDLSTAYTPGVAEPCREIAKDVDKAYDYTIKSHTIAVVTDGSAVLGPGNIGPEAALPVMEGKAVLFKEFGGVDAFPICLDTQDTDEIVDAVIKLAPTFGGINLEDIAAPRCFEIERRLNEALDIPVFHDDQHGTAAVVAAAVINAYRLLGRDLSSVKTVINGAGAAGIAIAKMLRELGIRDIVLVDSKGAITTSRTGLNSAKQEWAVDSSCVTLADVMCGRDLFIGVSAPNVVSEDMVRSMAPDPVIFPLANPTPEIMPDLAKHAGAAVVGTGRSDFPNQINNVLVFPGVFKGVLEHRVSEITPQMLVKAAHALAGMVSDEELSAEYVIPDAFTPGVADVVAAAVA